MLIPDVLSTLEYVDIKIFILKCPINIKIIQSERFTNILDTLKIWNISKLKLLY